MVMMNPIWQALLGPWEWRPEVLAVLLPLMAIYVGGWIRIRRRRDGETRLATGWRMAAYLAGMGTLMVALLSPIDALGGQLFFMHMIQHKLSIMVAAPLIWLGNPFPIGLWGLPAPVRRSFSSIFSDASPVRPWLSTATQPFVVWLTFIIVYVGWHDPGAYNLALRIPWVHDIQHLTFFLTALLFWWHVVGAAPRLHPSLSPWIAIAMLIGAIPFNAITGFAIANAGEVVYTYYESVPRIWGFTVMEDQAIGGVIMWVPGSEMLFQAAGVILAAMFIRERRKNRLAAQKAGTRVQTYDAPRADQLPDAAFIAPGLEHRARQNEWRALTNQREQARHNPGQEQQAGSVT